MRMPLLLDADKSITESAQTYLREGKWKIVCDDSETTFQVITDNPLHSNIGNEFGFDIGTRVRVVITQRGKPHKISIYAERL